MSDTRVYAPQIRARLVTTASLVVTVTGGISSHDLARKVDVRLPGTGNSNSHGARPIVVSVTGLLLFLLYSLHRS